MSMPCPGPKQIRIRCVARFARTGTRARSEYPYVVVVGRVQELKRTCLRAWDSERGADAVARM